MEDLASAVKASVHAIDRWLQGRQEAVAPQSGMQFCHRSCAMAGRPTEAQQGAVHHLRLEIGQWYWPDGCDGSAPRLPAASSLLPAPRALSGSMAPLTCQHPSVRVWWPGEP